MKRDASSNPPSVERIRREAGSLGVELSTAQATSLRSYAELLLERAVPLGLISDGDAGRVFERHILDCLRAAQFLTTADPSVFDLGSGAGLPGVPLAIATPSSRVLLIESRGRAAGFLEYALAFLRLPNVQVFPSRADEVESRADVVAARAFAPLRRTWPVAARLLKPGGRLVYFAGRRFDGLRGTVEGLEPRPERAELLANIRPLVIMTAS